jgi:hypothetical protein
MRFSERRPILVLAALLALGLAACQDSLDTSASPAVGASGPPASVGGLTFPAPTEWQARQPSTSMRLAEYAVPGSGGEASLVIFRFPGGGSAQANIDRWVGQFKGAEKSNGGSGPAIQQQQRDGLTLTTLDVSGDYEGAQMPGAPPQPAVDGARLLALVIEGKGDPYFLKLQGPGATIGVWADRWSTIVASIRVE